VEEGNPDQVGEDGFFDDAGDFRYIDGGRLN
jgi:hypothetical protein